MDIAKTAETVKPVIVQSAHSTTPLPTYDYDGVPIDILRFFNIDLGNVENKVKDQLLEISKWAFDGSETLGDGMRKLKDLEIKLGSPRLDETRHGRLYNWVRFQRQIDDMRKRQEAISG